MGTLSKYSDLFMIFTVLLLAVSHWIARKNKSRLNKIILWISTVLVFAIIAYGKRTVFLDLLKG